MNLLNKGAVYKTHGLEMDGGWTEGRARNVKNGDSGKGKGLDRRSGDWFSEQ